MRCVGPVFAVFGAGRSVLSQGDDVARYTKKFTVFRGRKIITRTPCEKLTITIRKPIIPEKRPPALVVDRPDKWWWAEYRGPDMWFAKNYEVLCYVAAHAERYALDAVLAYWPHLAGFIHLEEFETSREWCTRTWLQGGFRKIDEQRDIQRRP
jgi:hypothetical protein